MGVSIIQFKIQGEKDGIIQWYYTAGLIQQLNIHNHSRDVQVHDPDISNTSTVRCTVGCNPESGGVAIGMQ